MVKGGGAARVASKPAPLARSAVQLGQVRHARGASAAKSASPVPYAMRLLPAWLHACKASACCTCMHACMHERGRSAIGHLQCDGPLGQAAAVLGGVLCDVVGGEGHLPPAQPGRVGREGGAGGDRMGRGGGRGQMCVWYKAGATGTMRLSSPGVGALRGGGCLHCGQRAHARSSRGGYHLALAVHAFT